MSNRLLALLTAPALAIPCAAQLGSADTLVAELEPGPLGGKPIPVAALGDRVILKSFDGVATQSVWISDGTGAGTVKLKDFPPELGVLDRFCDVGDQVIWVAGEMLYRTDGTPFGTYAFFDLDSLDFHIQFVLWSRPLGDTGQCVFAVRENFFGFHLVRTDGTAAGTVDYVEVGDAQHAAAIGDRIYFAGRTSSGIHQEPWVTDGTAAGTHLLVDLPPADVASQPSAFTALGDLVYFQAKGQLWRTDGTALGTEMVADPPGTPSNLAAFGDALLFISGGTPSEVWISDGTEPGTLQLSFVGGFDAVFKADLHVAGPIAYFVARPNSPDLEVWRTDGTVAGTFFVSSIAAWSFENPNTDDGRLVFARDGSDGAGVELWITLGTPETTALLADIAGGAGDSTPISFRRVGANIFFDANDGITGDELHAVTIAETGGWIASPYGTGCGSMGAPRMTTSLAPTLGDLFGIGVEGAPTWLFLSGDPDFVPLGGGCAGLILSPLFVGAFVTNGSGAGELVAAIPDAPVLAGLPLYFQAALATGAGPFAGLDLTGGLEVVLGP